MLLYANFTKDQKVQSDPNFSAQSRVGGKDEHNFFFFGGVLIPPFRELNPQTQN